MGNPNLPARLASTFFDRGVLKLAAPVLAGHVLALLYGTADVVFVSLLGRADTSAVAGMGLALPLNLAALAIGTALLAGSASVGARARGADDRGTVAALGRTTCALGLLAAAALLAILEACAPALVGLLAGGAVSGPARDAAESYVRWAAPGYALLAFQLGIVGLQLGKGRTATYGIAMAISTLVNIVLDPVAIFALGLGVAGAAAATSAAIAASTVFVVADALRSGERLLPVRGQAPASPRVAAELLRIGFPQALTLLTVSLSFAGLNRVVGSFGEDLLNAWIVVGRAEECVLMIGYAVGSACMFMAGTAWGKGDRGVLRDAASRCARTGLSLAIVLVVPYVVLAPLVFRAFTGNPAVLAACVRQVRAVSWTAPAVAVSLIAVSGFQGIGKPMAAFGMTALRLGAFLILPVVLLRAAGLLDPISFLAVFAASNLLGGAVSRFALAKSAEALPPAPAQGLGSKTA